MDGKIDLWSEGMLDRSPGAPYPVDRTRRPDIDARNQQPSPFIQELDVAVLTAKRMIKEHQSAQCLIELKTRLQHIDEKIHDKILRFTQGEMVEDMEAGAAYLPDDCEETQRDLPLGKASGSHGASTSKTSTESRGAKSWDANVIKQLQELGFDHSQVLNALNAADGNMERAANYLLGIH
ncbi:hypothetical protein GUITHDRAFT_100163 [Guillardia theta CCMP2712]|uniref:UBA domain-containing protein n=2 Tax=Guillardia theta TaxID=55529 RepID=L1K039_GUITC|nr:hypothetical protein GUITHDRAFT_100163 [Guillardia theta CCMP2712]EKX53914.1 hypothetical protein GUITHDRAFT_100163 [Guillardia theta CCMP2712]|eukprot:XP_005840894.1 hypothetical protein GUITHDRAFT_100163 [Guillardia theta CCMP2712]